MVATSPSDVDPTQLSIMQVPALEAAAKQYNLLLYIVHIIILLQRRGGGGGEGELDKHRKTVQKYINRTQNNVRKPQTAVKLPQNI